MKGIWIKSPYNRGENAPTRHLIQPSKTYSDIHLLESLVKGV